MALYSRLVKVLVFLGEGCQERNLQEEPVAEVHYELRSRENEPSNKSTDEHV